MVIQVFRCALGKACRLIFLEIKLKPHNKRTAFEELFQISKIIVVLPWLLYKYYSIGWLNKYDGADWEDFDATSNPGKNASRRKQRPLLVIYSPKRPPLGTTFGTGSKTSRILSTCKASAIEKKSDWFPIKSFARWIARAVSSALLAAKCEIRRDGYVCENILNS